MTGEDFIEAIRVRPDDHGLRLAWADWLERCDPARARLVRLQTLQHVGLVELPTIADSSRLCACQVCSDVCEARGLLDEYGWRWVCPSLENKADRIVVRPRAIFDRGMVTSLSMECLAHWRSHAAEIFAHSPLANPGARDLTSCLVGEDGIAGVRHEYHVLRIVTPDGHGRRIPGWLVDLLPAGIQRPDPLAFLPSDVWHYYEQNVPLYPSGPAALAAASEAIRKLP